MTRRMDNLKSRAEQSRAEQSRAEQSRAEQSRIILEYDCLRVIATIFVVLGHCTYIKISTNYGGIDYSIYASNVCVFMQCVQMVTSFLYLFHMPLFMALSGALFFKAVKNGKYGTIIQIAKDKGNRLLLPFLIVSIFYSFPLKLVSGYYVDSSNIFKDLIVGQLMVQGNTHLWYLAALFFIFLFSYGLEKYIKGHGKLKLIILGLLCLCSSHIDIKLLSYIAHYGFWFYAGYYFEPKRRALNNKINIYVFLLTAILSGAAYCIYYIFYASDQLIVRLVFKMINILVCGLCCLSVYMFAYLISKTKLTETTVYRILQRNSFGIYLYSDSWNYVVLAVGFGFAGEQLLTSNGCAVLIYFIRFFGTLFISIGVTELVRRFRLKCLS